MGSEPVINDPVRCINFTCRSFTNVIYVIHMRASQLKAHFKVDKLQQKIGIYTSSFVF